jgi:hypothetical protein
VARGGSNRRGGSLWIYHNPNAALVALGILALFT